MRPQCYRPPTDGFPAYRQVERDPDPAEGEPMSTPSVASRGPMLFRDPDGHLLELSEACWSGTAVASQRAAAPARARVSGHGDDDDRALRTSTRGPRHPERRR